MKRPKPFSVGDVKVRATREPTKRNPRWEWRAVRNRDGGRISVWSGRASRHEALKIVSGLVTESEVAIPRRHGFDPSVKTVKDLLECWLFDQEDRGDLAERSKGNLKRIARRLTTCIGDVRLSQVGSDTQRHYRDRSGLASGTVALDLGYFRSACKWARDRGASIPPLGEVRIKHVRVRNDRTPEHREVVEVLEQLDGWSWLAVLLLATTGARVGEIASLTWERIDLDNDEITVTGKTGTRTVPIWESDVTNALSAAKATGEPLWPRKPSTVARRLIKDLDAACAAAEVPVFTPHGLRRYVVTRLFDAGVDPGVAAKITGHSEIVAMRLYRKVTPSRLREAVAKARLGAVSGAKVIPLARVQGE